MAQHLPKSLDHQSTRKTRSVFQTHLHTFPLPNPHSSPPFSPSHRNTSDTYSRSVSLAFCHLAWFKCSHKACMPPFGMTSSSSCSLTSSSHEYEVVVVCKPAFEEVGRKRSTRLVGDQGGGLSTALLDTIEMVRHSKTMRIRRMSTSHEDERYVGASHRFQHHHYPRCAACKASVRMPCRR